MAGRGDEMKDEKGGGAPMYTYICGKYKHANCRHITYKRGLEKLQGSRHSDVNCSPAVRY
jgi:hypothetical protein